MVSLPARVRAAAEGLSTSALPNNQLAGFGYDIAGNMISNGGTGYIYDAENRLIATSGMSYVYDGDGQRVEKCTQGTTPGTCATSATGTLYWRSTAGETLTESDLAGNPQEEYIFFGGRRIARRDVTSAGATIAVHYYFSDHLGTHAVVTNAAGTQCEQDIDYYPYGGQQHDYCATPVPQHYQFTGKERDSESGLDNFGARFNASSLGRFMTPDWAAKPITVPYAVFGDPQTLNLYAYVENAPVNRADADGHVGPDSFSPCNTESGLRCDNRNDMDYFKLDRQLPQPIAEQLTLPGDPSKLGPEWVLDSTNKAPNRLRYLRGDGYKLDFDKGKKGKNGWRGKDHWHVTKPGEEEYDKSLGHRGHIDPGTAIDIPDFAPKVSSSQPPIPSELKIEWWRGTDADCGGRMCGAYSPGVYPGMWPGEMPVGASPSPASAGAPIPDFAFAPI